LFILALYFIVSFSFSVGSGGFTTSGSAAVAYPSPLSLPLAGAFFGAGAFLAGLAAGSAVSDYFCLFSSSKSSILIL